MYAPQSGLSYEDKDMFFDWNGHLGSASTEYREVHGGMNYDSSEPGVEGERILEYALAFDLF